MSNCKWPAGRRGNALQRLQLVGSLTKSGRLILSIHPAGPRLCGFIFRFLCSALTCPLTATHHRGLESTRPCLSLKPLYPDQNKALAASRCDTPPWPRSRSKCASPLACQAGWYAPDPERVRLAVRAPGEPLRVPGDARRPARPFALLFLPVPGSPVLKRRRIRPPPRSRRAPPLRNPGTEMPLSPKSAAPSVQKGPKTPHTPRPALCTSPAPGSPAPGGSRPVTILVRAPDARTPLLPLGALVALDGIVRRRQTNTTRQASTGCGVPRRPRRASHAPISPSDFTNTF